ncbi:MAG: hydroxyacylglutathione hydrolase [Bdellovibrionales bacterium]|nr:hydroxyacylglutathione hydrolase [Bdellovibrionales bacterium]
MSLNVSLIPILTDNYVFIIESANQIAIIDPGDFESVDSYLVNKNWFPDYIFNTHHHWDHVDGNLQLQSKYNLKIYCSKYDKNRIPGANSFLTEGDQIQFGNTFCEIINLPGHTLGHIAYYFKKENILFVGDTLFSMGCGRLFEGSHEQLFDSLKKISSLPDETKIYCTHEYTQKNTEFALKFDPDNEELKSFYQDVLKKRKLNLPTIPTLLGREKQLNPFLRGRSIAIQKSLHLTNSGEFAVFKQLRDLRNDY